MITEELGLESEINNNRINWVRASKVVVTKENTTIVEGAGDTAANR